MKAERWMFVRVGMSERVAGRRWRGIVVVGWVGSTAGDGEWDAQVGYQREEGMKGLVVSGYIEEE